MAIAHGRPAPISTGGTLEVPHSLVDYGQLTAAGKEGVFFFRVKATEKLVFMQ